MEENKKTRKERIKSIAIVFLAVMLVLTFFSQTIMNYSLPQVATKRVMSDTITAKVRGSGTVTATDPYDVVVEESRKIKSVKVKNGDIVTKGDVIFELEDEESDELRQAKKDLEALQESYNAAIINADANSTLVSQVESGNVSSAKAVLAKIDEYNQKIDSLTETVKKDQRKIEEIEGKLAGLPTPTVDTSKEEKAVKEAEAALQSKETAFAKAQAEADAAREARDAIKKPLDDATAAYEEAKAKYDEINTELTEKQSLHSQMDTDKSTDSSLATNAAWVAEYTKIQGDIEDLKSEKYFAQIEHDKKLAEKTTAETAFSASDVQARYDAANDVLNQKQTALQDAATALSKAQASLTTAQEKLTAKQNSAPDTSSQDALEKEKRELSLHISATSSEKEEVQKKLSDLMTGYGIQTNLLSILDRMNEKKKEIADLTGKSIDTVIKAPASGIISGISLTAGSKFQAGTMIAQIVSAEKGYSLSFSVTADQAKKITIGDSADIQNSWYYSDVRAVVTGFKADPNNRQNKLVLFTVSGDVVDGQNLTLSVGSKSSNYDLVVPNSAIREDNNGKFILIIESKSSPLGNRYQASRVDIEVIASDDTCSAIRAGLYGYEYVITTSTQPIEAGQYVRFSEN